MLSVVIVSYAEQFSFVEGLSDQLQSDRQAGLRKPARDRQAGQPGQVCRNGVDVAQVHGNRIFALFAELERRGGGGRSKNDVDFLEDPFEIPPDQGSGFLSSQIIGVVVTAAQAIGAENATSLDFFAEPFAAALGIDVDCIFRAIAARRVTNAIISGEVGGSFGGGDYVIDGIGKIGRGEEASTISYPLPL